ncbi:MAG: hypothetical protein OEN23_09825 [Paracoccaceae bacterium]|nr:hypothetical protein [Paracoccaceae bacterium]
MFKRQIFATCLAAALALPGAALAEEGTGTATYIVTWSESTPRPGGGAVQHVRMKGVVLADDAKSALHGASQTCQGANVVGADGGAITGHGVCDAVDADGDTWSIWYANDAGGRRWGIIGGTGKFQNMTGGGTTKVIVPPRNGRVVISWEGTWER